MPCTVLFLHDISHLTTNKRTYAEKTVYLNLTGSCKSYQKEMNYVHGVFCLVVVVGWHTITKAVGY